MLIYTQIKLLARTLNDGYIDNILNWCDTKKYIFIATVLGIVEQISNARWMTMLTNEGYY